MDSLLQSLAELPKLMLQLQVQLEANTKALDAANELIGETRLYEKEAANYLNVDPKTMYNYRRRGLS